MRAWQLYRVSDLGREQQPLTMAEVPTPEPATDEVLIEISCCGICHTELDEIEGRTPPPRYPVIPGHQVVGTVVKKGALVTLHKPGDRVGVAWIFSACGTCDACRSGLENLCEHFTATGRDADGGYAQYMVVPEKYAIPIPTGITDHETAPLLCAGAIGYRSLRLANLSNGQTLGLTGFGASAHLVLKMVKHLYPDTPIVVFARSGPEQQFARSLGAAWAGGTEDTPPFLSHAIIDTTPAWAPIVFGMERLHPAGRLVINAIRKEPGDQSALQKMDYARHLWMEKEIKSVANITARDVREFLELAAAVPIHPKVELCPFERANEALMDLKNKHVVGAKVLAVK